MKPPLPEPAPSATAESKTPSSWDNASVGRVAAPLREQVLVLVRRAIMNFELKPGQRLVERELMERLEVSRTTVREVIGQLSAEGLITVIPQKGAIVTVPTADDAADLYEIRASLEALAVTRFVERASADKRAELRKIFDTFVGISRESDAFSALQAKDEVYRVLLEGAASGPLQQVLTSVQGRVRAMRATSLSEPGRMIEAARELRAVIEAIEAGDAPRAAAACALHVRNAARTGLGRLAAIESGLEEPPRA